MARGGKYLKKRPVKLDAKYGSAIVTKMINRVMQAGKKSTAAKVVYSTLQQLSDQTKEEPLRALDKALGNIKPAIEVRSRRVGGANYQVPFPVPDDRQLFLALKWIVEAARAKGGESYDKRLLGELMAAYKGEGDAVKKKQDVERMAEANKAFSHFKW
jgi:small subunit ribosomal protein S7